MWQRLRSAKLMLNPICEPCSAIGRIEVATLVDHVQAISDGGEPFPEMSGLMSMCSACHNRKHSPKGAFIGCDESGMPIGNHPWNAESGG
jgi:5-methylcytosine-specific restriction endonuclease McrA